ncbi:MAG: hypothetical protein K0Q49_1068 [Haloplasmataceae bacterium]|nr:hypothetical protein [Haloplasmataceae bacterium]
MPMDINVWIFLLIMILTGAWTGYITNDVAIKMLFKEYGIGKFKLGGVIVRTRKDLEKNLALLVEKEIINHNTLKSQFYKPEVKEAISKTVAAFFNDSIYKNTNNVKLKELPGFTETTDKIIGFLKKYLETNLATTLVDLSKSIDLGDLISNEQAHNLSMALTKEIIGIIKNDRIIVKLITELYKNYQDVSLNEIIGPEINHVIINNLNELLNNIFDEMRYKNDRDIQTLISKLYRDLDFDTFVESLEKYIGDKKINYFLNEQSLEKLYDLFNEYLKNPNSKESIEVFCDGLIIALKKIDKPIIDLFSGDLRVEVEKFLEHQLPGIIDKLIVLVQKNSNEIEKLIEESIDQTIYDQQTIKRLILGAIRMFLIENFTQKYDIINKIVEMLKGIDIEDLSKTISEQVVEILHQKSITSIISELENNNILTSKIISSQVHRILKFLVEKYLSKDIEHADFLNKSVNDLFKINLKTFVNNLTVSVLTKQIIYNEDILKFVRSKISNSLNGITKLSISHFILPEKVDDYANKVQDEINRNLDKNKDQILDVVYKNLSKFLENNDLNSLIQTNNEVKFKSEFIVEVITNALNNAIIANSDYKMHELFEKVNSIDNLSENVITSIMDYLDNGLSNVLEGNIARVVENNIKTLSNDEILEMMQEFMGSKLKPLTVLGAYLGAIVGLVLGLISFDEPMIFNFKTLYYTVPIYALLGYITNVAAIYFIFKPYKPLFGIKWLQGILPKQIPVLAVVLGKIVSKNLLSEESIGSMLYTNEDKIKSGFKNNVKKDNFKVITTYLNENSKNFVKTSHSFILNFLRDNNAMVATKLTGELMGFDLKKIQTNILVEVFTNIFVEKLNSSADPISNYILMKSKSSKTIKELSSDLNITTVEDKIDSIIENEVNKFISKFSDVNYLAEIILGYSDKINSIIGKDINEVMPESSKITLENFLYNLVSTYLYSKDKQKSLSNYVINEITIILNNNDSIDELFGGRFIELVNFNMSSILEKIEETTKNWLNGYKDEINESVTSRVVDELTVVQQVGYKAINGDKLIKETVYRIIDQKLPEFISRKFDNLNNEFENFFENLGKIRLKDAKLELKKEELFGYLNEVFESKEIEIKTRRFIHIVMTHFYSFKTAKIFDILGVKTTESILYKYKDIFILFNNGMYNSLDNRKDKIVQDVSLLINKFITNEILSNRVRNLTLGLTEFDTKKLVENSITILNKNDFLYNNTHDLIEIVFKQFVNIPITELVDDLFLKQDLKKLIKKLSIDQHFDHVLNTSFHKLITLVITEFDSLVDDELKEVILTDIINSTYEAISLNLLDILKAVDINEVTIRQINAMEPRQIKDLFDSLGKKYFRKLENYGVFGGIFAIELASAITFLYYILQNINKKPKN